MRGFSDVMNGFYLRMCFLELFAEREAFFSLCLSLMLNASLGWISVVCLRYC